MIKSLIHTTENNNLYIYDDQSRLSMLIHPELKKAHEKSTDVNPYYQKKYEYLKKYGFFSKSSSANFEILSEARVKETLINTPQVTFEVTDACNLNCTYCGYGDLYEVFDTRNRNNINVDYAVKFLKYIFDLKYENKKNKLFISFYGGEPLLNIDFIKHIVELANQLKSEKEMDIDYGMTTNGTLLHKYIPFLVDNKFNLNISLDGNEKNNSYRVFGKDKKNSFRKIIENVDMIQRDYPDYFMDHINFSAVIHNRNSVKDIYEFIYSRYHKIPKISELSLVNVKRDKKEIVENMYNNMRRSEAEYLKEEANLLRTPYGDLSIYELSDFLKLLSVNFYISDKNSMLNAEEKYFPTSTCLPFSRKIFLTNRNKLLPCERINYKYTLGKVEEDIVIDTKKIAQQYNFFYDHIKKFCQYCYAYRYCGLCLFHLKNLDDLGTEKFVCDRFYDQKSFSEKLNRSFSLLEKYPKFFFQILENEIAE